MEEEMEFANAHSDCSDSEEDDGGDQDGPKQVYVPGTPLKEDEELICDESAYLMYHQAQTGTVFESILFSLCII